ncbi:MAG: hypothetical protein JWN15_3250, partial [Firmicutes bacterium]|nr:hypothetical protein [Bacillota bacterium]
APSPQVAANCGGPAHVASLLVRIPVLTCALHLDGLSLTGQQLPGYLHGALAGSIVAVGGHQPVPLNRWSAPGPDQIFHWLNKRILFLDTDLRRPAGNPTTPSGPFR